MSPEQEESLSERLGRLADEPSGLLPNPYREAEKPASEPAAAPPGDLPEGKFRCKRCGDEDVLPGPLEKILFHCDKCGTCYAFGSELARYTHQPHAEDRRFITQRVEHAGTGLEAKFALEKTYARSLALDLLSIADPALYAALTALEASLRNSSSAPTEPECSPPA